MPNNQLHQININYNPVEDRILLRASTTGKLEYRVWMTRRFTALLLTILTNSLAEDGDIAMASPEAKKPLMDFKKQEALGRANFSEPYKEDDAHHFPFGPEGMLAQKIVYKKQEASLRITITPGSGKGMNLLLESSMQQILKKMLEDAIASAKWNIPTEKYPPQPLPLATPVH